MKQKIQILALIISIFIVLGSVAFGSDISISAEVSRLTIAFEETDTLTVKLTWQGEPFLYQIDDFPMPGLEKLQILGSSSSVASKSDPDSPSGELTVRTYTYILEPVNYGTAVISPLTLNATNKLTQESHVLQTGKLTVEIAKPVPKKVQDTGVSSTTIGFSGGGVIAFVVAIFIVRRMRAKKVEEPTGDSAYVNDLETVKKETVADRKLFYSRLYRLLIKYLEKEQGLDLSGKTGEEVIIKLQDIENDEVKATFISWLERLQLEKYRPDAPASGEVEEMYRTVKKFFENKSV